MSVSFHVAVMSPATPRRRRGILKSDPTRGQVRRAIRRTFDHQRLRNPRKPDVPRDAPTHGVIEFAAENVLTESL